MTFTAGAVSDPSISCHVGSVNQLRLDAEHLVLKGFLLEQPGHLLLASENTQLLRDTPLLDDLADLSASAVLSAG